MSSEKEMIKLWSKCEKHKEIFVDFCPLCFIEDKAKQEEREKEQKKMRKLFKRLEELDVDLEGGLCITINIDDYKKIKEKYLGKEKLKEVEDG